MIFSWPPQNAAEMLALQQKYGRDADIAAALGVGRHTVELCRQGYRVPTVTQGTWKPTKAGENIGDRAIAEKFAGRRFR